MGGGAWGMDVAPAHMSATMLWLRVTCLWFSFSVILSLYIRHFIYFRLYDFFFWQDNDSIAKEMKSNGLTDRPTNSLRFQHSLDLINICQICQIFVRFVKSYIARPSYQLLVPWHVGFVQFQIAAQTKNIATNRSENARNSKWICAWVWRCFMMRHKMWMTTALKMIEAKDMEAVAPWRKLLRKSQLRDLL